MAVPTVGVYTIGSISREVVADQPVEQHLVAVVQGGQVDVLGQVTGLGVVLRVGAGGLLVQVECPGRQETDQIEARAAPRR